MRARAQRPNVDNPDRRRGSLPARSTGWVAAAAARLRRWLALPREEINPAAPAATETEWMRERLAVIRKLYMRGDMRGLCYTLRANLARSVNRALAPHPGKDAELPSKDVADYVNAVSFLLDKIAEHPEAILDTAAPAKCSSNGLSERMVPELSNEEKISFFNETRHAYGRTALMLSGGAGMGLNHLGVVKALFQNGLLPKVLSGTSAGAMVASMVCTMTTDELALFLESDTFILPLTGEPCSFSFFDNVSLSRKIRRYFKKGTIHDVRWFQGTVRRNVGEYTFREAFARTGRILNITVTPLRSSEPPIILNYLTAPHVMVWSAACASAALPMIFAPIELIARDAKGNLVPYHVDLGVRWVDGSIKSDVPLARVGELFNVSHFIVSQMNPHVIPRGSWLLRNRLATFLKREFRFRYSQLLDLNIVPSFINTYFHHFIQPYSGDVTIMPQVRPRDLFRLIRNPTLATVTEYVRQGEQLTEPHLDIIRNRVLLELTLDRCLTKVTRRTELHESSSIENGRVKDINVDGRVPRWLWQGGPS